MRIKLPARDYIIGVILIVTGISVYAFSQDNSKQITKDDQIKLQTAYREWQDSAKTTEIMKLKFNSIALEVMGNLGLPPKDNDISVDSNGQFIIIKKAVSTQK